MVTVPPLQSRPLDRDRKPSQSRDGWILAARVLLGLALLATIVASLVAGGETGFVVMISAIPVTLTLIARRYGWRLLALYLVVAFTVGTVFENLSITTGFPFGHYHYPGNSLRIWHFPVLTGVLYCVLGLICWLTTSALLDGADSRLADRTDPAWSINVVALPVVAAALMTLFDLGSDSVASTLRKTWVWENGGGIFGVPWTNYLGWWLVTYVFFQIFALVLATRRRPLPGQDNHREPLAHGVLLYFLLGMASLAGFATAPRTTVTDLAGTTWSVHALYETMFTINLFGTIFIASLAGIRLARNDLALHRR